MLAIRSWLLVQGVKAEIVNLLRGGWFGDQPSGMLILCFYI